MSAWDVRGHIICLVTISEETEIQSSRISIEEFKIINVTLKQYCKHEEEVMYS